MEDEVKSSSKRNLVSSTSAGHVEKMGDEKRAKRSDTQKVVRNGGEEDDRNCDGVWIKSDLERVGEEWRK